MKKDGILQIITSFLLVFVMILGMFIPIETVFAEEGAEVKGEVTEFTVTNADGFVEPGGYIDNQIFRLNYKWKASNGDKSLNEGDYFQMDLPDKFKFPTEQSYCEFDIKEGGDVVAKVTITPKESGGGKIRVTFTNYVNGKAGITGEMHLTARWNQDTYPITELTEHEIKVDEITTTIKIRPYIPPNYATEVIYKTSGQTLTSDGLVRWRIRVNAKQGTLKNAVIKDTLKVAEPGSPDGIEYVNGKFMLYELVWENGKLIEKNPQNISNQIELSADKRSFTYNFGNLDGKGYIIHYRTTYKQGLLLQNKVELTSDEEKPNPSYGQFVDAQSGGGIQGLLSRIKITKVAADDDMVKLEGAKFKITRKETGGSVELVTNAQGEAISMPLIPGEYEIEETEAPAHYEKDEQKYTVTVTADQAVEKTIQNKPEKTEVSVKKKWIGAEKDSVLVELKAEGSNDVIKEYELKKSEGWKHTFTGLDKYTADGTLIKYKVVEKNVPQGYAATYEQESDNLWIIKNTQDKTKVKVTKEWEGVTGNHPTIKLQLLKNGQNEGSPIELTNGTTTYTWTDLDKTDAQGNEYNYTVKEVGETANSIQLNGDWYKVSYGGNTQDGLTVTNKKLSPWTPMEPPVREIKVTKLWKNHNGKPISPPTDKIIVELYKDGNPTGKKEELNAGNNWIVSFKNLEVADGVGSTNYYKYTVKEVGEDGNTVKFDGKLYKVVYEGSMKDGFTITNEKEAPPTPPTPNTPSNPTPDKPEVPNNPTPNIPEIPNIPEVPNNPTPNIPEIPNIPEVPNNPTPNIPKTPNKPKIPNKTLPKTGNHSDISLYAWLLLTSGSLIILLGIEKRKHAK